MYSICYKRAALVSVKSQNYRSIDGSHSLSFLYEVLESVPSNFLKLVSCLRSSWYDMLHEYCLHKKYLLIGIMLGKLLVKNISLPGTVLSC